MTAQVLQHPAAVALKLATLLSPSERQLPDNEVLEMLDVEGKANTPLATANNLSIVLTHDPRWRGMLAFNAFQNCVFYGAEKLLDHHLTEVDIWLDRVYRLRASTSRIREAVLYCARANRVHPVQEYLLGLDWDHVPRIDTWLTTYFGVEDTPLARACGRKWLISAVLRAMEPGCKVDTVLVITGDQGLGKSTVLRKLAGTAWFSDTDIDLASKDRYQQLAGKWIYEVAELQSFRGRDATAIKAYLSSAIDNYRPAYGATNMDVPRSVVFAATSNDDEFLDDPTGSRRFWAVRATRAHHELIERDRDLLWAEATHAWAEGELHYLTRDEERLLRASNAAFETQDPWHDLIGAFVTNRAAVILDEIAREVLHFEPREISKATQMRIAAVLKRLGWRRDATTRPVRWRKPML